MPDILPVPHPQDPVASAAAADNAFAARKSAEDDAALARSIQAAHPELAPKPPAQSPDTTGGMQPPTSAAEAAAQQQAVEGFSGSEAAETTGDKAVDFAAALPGSAVEMGARAAGVAPEHAAMAGNVTNAAMMGYGLVKGGIAVARGIKGMLGAGEEAASALPRGTVLDAQGQPVTSAPAEPVAASGTGAGSIPAGAGTPETAVGGEPGPGATQYPISAEDAAEQQFLYHGTRGGGSQSGGGVEGIKAEGGMTHGFFTEKPNPLYGPEYLAVKRSDLPETLAKWKDEPPSFSPNWQQDINQLSASKIHRADAQGNILGPLVSPEAGGAAPPSPPPDDFSTPQGAAQTLAEKQLAALKTVRVGETVAKEFGKPEIATTVPEPLSMQEAAALRLNLDHFYNQGVQQPTLAAHTAAMATTYQTEAQSMHEAAVDLIQRANGGEDVTKELGELTNRASAFAVNSTQLLGERSETGRALQILDPTKPGNMQVTATMKLAQQLGFGENPRQTAEMLARLTPDQIPRTLRDLGEQSSLGRSLYNGLLEYYKGNLLSNAGRTTSRVATSNALSNLMTIPTRAVASVIPGSPVKFGEPLAMTQGYVDGFWHSVDVATESFKTGNAVFTNEDPNAYMSAHNAISSEAFGLDPDTLHAKAVDYLGSALRLPTRGLTAAHQFWFSMATSMNEHALAWRDAVNQAQAAGLDGSAGYNRATELYHQTLANMPAEMKAAARKAGSVDSFINQIEGKVPKAAETIAKAPGLNLIMPFFRVAYNVKKWGLDYTPGIGVATQAGDLMEGGAPRSIAVGKQALAVVMATMVHHEVMQGRITGDGPPPGAARDALMASGWRPNSFHIGDRYVQIPEPFSTPFGILANYSELSSQLDDATNVQRAAMVLQATGRALSNDTIVQGLSNIKQLANDAEQNGFGPAFEKFTGQVASGLVPYSALMKAIVHSYDTPRNPRSALEVVEAGIPKLSENVAVRRDLFGQPSVGMPGVPNNLLFPVNVTKARPDEVEHEIIKNNPTFERVPRWINGRAQRTLDDPNNPDIGVHLTPEEQDRWAVLRGDGLHEQLQMMVRSSGYQTQSQTVQKQLLEYIGAQYAEIATDKLMAEDRSLLDRVTERERAAKESLRPPAPGTQAPAGFTLGGP